MARRLLLWSALLEAVMATACLGVLLSRVPVVTQANFQQIRLGMTLPEVEFVLGCPPGDYQTEHYYGSAIRSGVTVHLGPETPGIFNEWWQFGDRGDSTAIWIALDDNGKVIRASYFRSYWPNYLPWPQRVLRWLGR